MPNIVITGATGVVGRRAVRILLARGHRVAGVTRSVHGRSLLEGLGARAVEAEVFDQPALESAFAGADIVVNLLTHVPPADRMALPGAWEENDRLRREASASHLTRADVENARRGVSPSVGRRDAYQPTVWLDDAGTAVAAAVIAPTGTYNVADDDPPTRAEIDAALAAVVGRDALRPPVDEIPPELEPLSRSQRVRSRKLQEASGWSPRVRGGTGGWRLIRTAPGRTA